MKRCCLDDLASWIDVLARTLQGTTMANDLSAVPDVLFGTWKQLSGTYVDIEIGEERPGLSKSPNGYIHFARDGRMFNLTVDSSRQRPVGPRPTAAEAEALYRSLIAYTGTFGVDGDRVFFDLDVSWNESWTGTRQIRTFKLAGNQLMITAEIINPMSGKPARHRLMFEKVQ
jgi:Lipocalin-like domain